MGGWSVYVSTLTEEETRRVDTETIRAGLLAIWDARDGSTWLDDLVASGKAVQLAKGGYPNRYTAKAADVLPLIENGGIKRAQYDHIRMRQFHKERMLLCRDDQVLTIEVWDQS